MKAFIALMEMEKKKKTQRRRWNKIPQNSPRLGDASSNSCSAFPAWDPASSLAKETAKSRKGSNEPASN